MRRLAVVLLMATGMAFGQAEKLTFEVQPGGGRVLSGGATLASIGEGDLGRCELTVHQAAYDLALERPPFDTLPLHIERDAGGRWRYRTAARDGWLNSATVFSLSRTIRLNVTPGGWKAYSDVLNQGAPGMQTLDVAGETRHVTLLQQTGDVVTLPRGWTPDAVFLTRSGFEPYKLLIPRGALQQDVPQYPETPIKLRPAYGPFSYPAFDFALLAVCGGGAAWWLYRGRPARALRRQGELERMRVADAVLSGRAAQKGKPAAAHAERVVTGSQQQRYLMLREIGSGGMGTVYEALQVGGTEPVAIKILHQAPAPGSAARQRFESEIKICGALQHPGIVKLLDHGELPDRTPFMVMELVSGQTLRALMEAAPGPRPPQQVVAWMLDVLAALRTAHEHGIVHRDLKPENLIETTSHRIKIMDFGIAHADDTHLTGDKERLGTPAYMAPEQFQARPVGPATDQYALGVVAYELLSGESPYGAVETPWAVMARALQGKPKPLRNVPPDLAAVVMRMLARRPEDRHADDTSLMQALQPFAA